MHISDSGENSLRIRLRLCRAAWACTTAWWLVCGVAAAQPPGGPAPVVVATVAEREVASGQTFVGTVMPLKRSAVGSAVDGRVAEFLVNEGDRVTKGQPLARLLMETIQAQVDAARAELDLRQAELDEMNNGSRPEEVRMAEARMQSTKALAEYSEAKFKRVQSLFREGRIASQEEFEEAESNHRRSQHDYLEAKEAYDLAVAGPREEKKRQAQARLAAQTALVGQLEDQKKKHTMISPFDGYVVAEKTEVGAWVSRGDLVAEIISVDEVDVQASVQDSHIQFVELGAEARVELPSIPGELFVGQVAIIVPEGDHRSRTFPVKVRLTNTIPESGPPLIKPGMLARVVLPTGAKQKSLLVPKDALVLGEEKAMIFVVQPDPKEPGATVVAPMPVDVGVASRGWVQVRAPGLKAGQQVVIEGNERLRPGQAVKAILRPDSESKP